MHGVGRVLRTAKRLELREIHQHFRRGFRSGGHHEFHLHSVYRSCFTRFGDCIGRRNDCNGSAGAGGSQAGAYGTLRPLVKGRRIHVRGAPPHGIAGIDVFGNGFFQESLRRQYLRFTGFDVLLRCYSLDPSKVVDMGVRVYNCLDRTFPCLRLFHFPMNGATGAVMLFMAAYLAACIAMGIAVSTLFRYRENSLLLLLWTSIPVLMLSGVSYPRQGIPDWLFNLGQIFPSSHGVNAFIRIQSMGASLSEVLPEIRMLCILALVYGGLACIGIHLVLNRADKDDIPAPHSSEPEK